MHPTWFMQKGFAPLPELSGDWRRGLSGQDGLGHPWAADPDKITMVWTELKNHQPLLTPIQPPLQPPLLEKLPAKQGSCLEESETVSSSGKKMSAPDRDCIASAGTQSQQKESPHPEKLIQYPSYFVIPNRSLYLVLSLVLCIYLQWETAEVTGQSVEPRLQENLGWLTAIDKSLSFH